MSTRTDLLKELEHEMTYYSFHTKAQYRVHVADYLDWLAKKERVEQWANRDVLYEYISYVQKKRKCTQAYINYLIRGPIGCLFRMNGLQIPVKLPKITRGRMITMENRTQFKPEEIASLIKAAKASKNPAWCAYMALSSIYGLRVSEMASMEKKDVHPLKKTIMVHTAKGGILTEHIVPDAIAPYLFNYDFPPAKTYMLNGILKEIAAKAGVDVPLRKSWHAVRHGAVTACQAVRDAEERRLLDDDTIFRFFRWSGGTTMNIYVTPDAGKTDERMFKHHPFLEYWV
jgi:integrase